MGCLAIIVYIHALYIFMCFLIPNNRDYLTISTEIDVVFEKKIIVKDNVHVNG